MKPMYLAAPERGPKTPIEDVMYPMYSHCVFNLNPRACSIDTPLHTFVPHQHVDHLHPNAVIAVAASVNQERLCREIYGDELIYLPWQRPGFDIGLMIERLIAENPRAKGVLLGHHGMWLPTSHRHASIRSRAWPGTPRALAIERSKRSYNASARCQYQRARLMRRLRGAAPGEPTEIA